MRKAWRRLRETFRFFGPVWTTSLLLDRLGFGTLGLWPDRAVAPEVLTAQVAGILRAWGMSEEHLPITVEHLTYADLHGIDSHGCGMLRQYHRDLVSGTLTMTPKIRILSEGGATALIDGGGGLGHVPADVAMRLAVEKCLESGLGAVAVRNSGHYGAAGAYARIATHAGCLGIATTNTRTPAVVPTFGVEAMLGTNPLAFAAPTSKGQPFLLDMATSTVPVGKLMTAWRAGRTIPPGWALDPHGKPVTEPRLAARYRRLTPLGVSREMGGHKGYGLAAMLEILCSALPGLRPSRGAVAARDRVGHFFLALDPRRFREAGEFEADLDAMLDSLRASKPADPARPVMVAGDPECTALAERTRSGVPLSRSVVEDIRAICSASDAPFLLDRESQNPGRCSSQA